ncbi:hypothetical protein [Deinococcus arenicola]|uniref:Uncharacterized protein n=1 Tax=Deinococcus arenicola TaxID=2994950 RepID=A0ABU4DT95_9DEIO|nr:hypothetical protein [Deinococcus sp. ZS9-10]MDV6375299.1 hypothetical protein [Deinococcus sp. ZS9-10]
MGLSELLLILVLLAGAVSGVVWIVRQLGGGVQRACIQALEARVRDLEQNQRQD